jgi:hypothetical protein
MGNSFWVNLQLQEWIFLFTRLFGHPKTPYLFPNAEHFPLLPPTNPLFDLCYLGYALPHTNLYTKFQKESNHFRRIKSKQHHTKICHVHKCLNSLCIGKIKTKFKKTLFQKHKNLQKQPFWISLFSQTSSVLHIHIFSNIFSQYENGTWESLVFCCSNTHIVGQVLYSFSQATGMVFSFKNIIYSKLLIYFE